MTCNEVAERYPKDYILMQRDNRDLFDPAGVVLYVGDNFTELFGLQVDLDIPLGIVVEGSYHRCSLGGLVVGE
jgi:hypothetical protein